MVQVKIYSGNNLQGGTTMSKKNLISRENDVTHEEHKIVCDNPELKELITDWCEQQGRGNYEQFAMFLELVGISTPVKLSGKSCRTLSTLPFQCVNVYGKEYTIALGFGDFHDSIFEIYVTEETEDGTVTKSYELFDKYKGEVYIPYAVLAGKTVTKGNMRISFNYSSIYWNAAVTVDDSHMMLIYVERPKCEEFSQKKVWICKDNEALEQYLFEYSYDKFVVDDVYSKLQEFFIEDITDLSIEYNKKVGNKKRKRILAAISVRSGIVETYACFDSYDEKSYLVKSNGDWLYSNDVCKIEYSKEQNKMYVSCQGNEDEISCIDLQISIMAAKKKIEKIWYKVNT